MLSTTYTLIAILIHCINYNESLRKSSVLALSIQLPILYDVIINISFICYYKAPKKSILCVYGSRRY